MHMHVGFVVVPFHGVDLAVVTVHYVGLTDVTNF